MKHIFYFLTILPIMWEVTSLINAKRIQLFLKNFLLIKNKVNEWNDTQQTFAFMMGGYFIWVFIGFFTFQYPLFILLFILGLIPKRWLWYRCIDSVISLIILIFLLLNTYHFKLDIWNLLIN